MNDTPQQDHSLVIRSLAAAADAGLLDERGIPKAIGPQFRAMTKVSYDKDARTLVMAISSEEPVQRWYGTEILSHAKGAIRTGRLEAGMAMLFNHDMDAHLGITTDWELKAGVLRTTNKFGSNPLALEKEGDVETGILRYTSIGYQVYEWDVEIDKDGVRTMTAVDWEPYENSLVTVPADPSVGVGRAAAKDAVPVGVRSFRKLDAESGEVNEEDDDEDPDDEGESSLPAPIQAAEAAPSTDSTNNTPATQRTIMPPEQTPAAEVIVDHAALNAARVTELRSLHATHPKFFDARSLKMAEDLGQSAERVKENIFEAFVADASRSNIPTAGEEVLDGLSDKDLSRYSLSGAYRAAAFKGGNRSFGKETGGFENEVSEAISKTASERGLTGLGGGVAVPSFSALAAARAKRTISSGGNAGASTNFTTVMADPIELLRNRTVLLAMGARMLIGLHGAVQMTKQTGAGTSNWVTEGTAATASDPTLGFFTMKPNRLTMQNSYYRDFLAQSALAVDSFLADDRLEVLARALDTAGLVGSGVAPVPLGLLNQTGLAVVLAGSTRAANGTVTAGAGGVPPTFVDYNNLEAAISTANADIGTMGIITTPRVRAAGRSTPQIPGTASGFVWPNSKVGANGIQEGPLGYNAICTSNPALTGFTANGVNNLHAIIMGVFNQILFGDWGLSELIADPYTGASQAKMLFTENAYYDINVRHIEAFAVCTSALPS